MTEADFWKPWTTVADSRYTLLEKLGAGGQAEVWRARDETAGVEVALKVLSPSLAHNEAAWAGLVREHAIASQLDHPLILKVQPPIGKATSRPFRWSSLPAAICASCVAPATSTSCRCSSTSLRRWNTRTSTASSIGI